MNYDGQKSIDFAELLYICITGILHCILHVLKGRGKNKTTQHISFTFGFFRSEYDRNLAKLHCRNNNFYNF